MMTAPDGEALFQSILAGKPPPVGPGSHVQTDEERAREFVGRPRRVERAQANWPRDDNYEDVRSWLCEHGYGEHADAVISELRRRESDK